VATTKQVRGAKRDIQMGSDPSIGARFEEMR
jgi:hypothetical protein